MKQNEIKDVVYLSPEQMIQLRDMIVDAIRSESRPVEDRISQREAFRLYGTGWVRDMVSRHPGIRYRRGNLWQFSRKELDALKASTVSPKVKPYRRKGVVAAP